MAVKYLSNKVKDLQVGITNYSENKGSSLYVVGNVGVGTNDATAEVGISNTSVLAVGILTAYRIFSSVYGEFQGGSVSADNITGVALSISGITTLSTVKISGGIVTATTGVVTYYGDGTNLTGVGGIGSLDQLSVSGLSTFTGLIRSNGGAYLAGITTSVNFTASTAKVTDLTNNRVVIAGSNGELEDDANLTYDGTVLSVGTGLTVTGVSTFAGITTATDILFTKNFSVSGVSTFNEDVQFKGQHTNAKWNKSSSDLTLYNATRLVFGDNEDFQIWHGGTHTFLRNSETGGDLRIRGDKILLKRSDDTGRYIECNKNSDVKLFYNEIEKFTTTGVGVTVLGNTETQSLNVTGVSTLTGNTLVGSAITMYASSGIVSATSFYGDGSNLDGVATPGIDTTGTSTFENIVVNGNAGIGSLNVTGISTFDADIYVADNIRHKGDGDTYIEFTGDRMRFIAGGKALIDAAEAGTDSVTINEGGNDLDFRVEGIDDEYQIFSDGLTNKVGIGSAIPKAKLDVNGTFNVTGVSTFNSKVTISGTNRLDIGDPNASIYRDSNDLIIDVAANENMYLKANTGGGTGGDIYVQAKSGENSIVANSDGSVQIYHDNAEKFATTGVGVTVLGNTETQSLNVTGFSTFAGTVTVNALFQVSGNTTLGDSESSNIDPRGIFVRDLIPSGSSGTQGLGRGDKRWDVYAQDLTVAGIATLASLGVSAGTTTKDLKVTGVSTFVGAIDANGGADISGGTGLTASTAKISDLTDNRIVIAGTAGELEDTTKLTFDGTTLAVVGDATFSGNVSIAGTLTKEDVTNIDSVGLVTARSGVRITAGGLVVSSGVSTFTDAIDANGGLDVTGGSGLVASTAKVSDLTSGRVVVAGTAGELEDASTFTFSGGTVTATAFSGSGANLTSLNGSNISSGTIAAARVATLNQNTTGTSGGFTAGSASNLDAGTLPDARFPATLPAISGANLTNLPTGITTTGTSTFETIVVNGHAGIGSLNVTGVSTLTTVDINAGHIDNTVIGATVQAAGSFANFIASIGTFTGNLGLSQGLTVTGVSTFTGAIDANGGVDVSGGSGLVASTAKISDLTSGRVVFAGTSGELEDASTLTFSGGTLSATTFSGSGANLTNLPTGITTTGTSTFETIVVNGNAGIGSLNVTGITTLAGNVFLGHGGDSDQINVNGYFISGLVPLSNNQFDLGTGGKYWRNVFASDTVVTDHVNASGVVTATSFSGDGSNLTGAGGDALISGITVQEESSTVGTAGSITILDFQGATVTAAASGSNKAVITVAGAGSTDGWIPDSQYNLFAGTSAGAARDADTCYNIGIGYSAGNALNAGDNNILLGCFAGNKITSGGCNVFLGQSAGKNETKSCNVYIGNEAACASTLSHSNVVMGYKSACKMSSACENVIIGIEAAAANSSSGNMNVYIGCRAGYCKQGASGNTILGAGAMMKGTNGECNVIIGMMAGEETTSGSRNVYIGETAAQSATSGSQNVAIGYKVCLPSNTGDYQLAIGSGASRWIVGNGDFNVGIGTTNPNPAVGVGNTAKLSVGIVSAYMLYGCGANITGIDAGFEPDADENLVAGTQAGANLDGSSGCFNVFLGACAGKNVASGVSNVYIGHCAGCCATGSKNIGIGNRAASAVSTGVNNVFMGNYAGAFDSGVASPTITGDRNIGIGLLAGRSITSGYDNIAIGCYSFIKSTTGNNNISIGCGAMRFGVVTGEANIALGRNVMCCLTSGNHNIAMGLYAGKEIAGGYCNIFFGNYAGANGAVTGCSNIGIGKDTLKSLTSGQCNIAIGCGVMGGATLTGNRNIVLGQQTGRCITTGCYNIFFGYYSAYKQNITGSDNIIMGRSSGCCLSSGGTNVLIGKDAGTKLTTGSNNIFLGNTVGDTGVVTGDINTFIGNQSGRALTSGATNVGLGYKAGCDITQGEGNTILGSGAGKNVTTGSCNVVIGKAVDVPSATGSRQLVIGIGSHLGWINGNANMNVGIGTTNPDLAVGVGNTAKLSVGILSAYQLYGDGSNLTNVGSASTNAWAADSQENLVAGNGAGAARDADTCFNIIIGCNAGAALNEGDDSIFLGRCAGKAATSGNRNLALGCTAMGDCAVTGSGNIALGTQAGKRITSGNKNVFIGDNTAAGTTLTGSYNIAFGTGAARCLTSGMWNFLGGYNAGRCITTAGYNIILGAGAAGSATLTGGCNVIMGNAAGSSLSSGVHNIIFGKDAAKTIGAGNCNVFIGFESGQSTGTPADNDASNNIGIGVATIEDLTDGDDNIAIGRAAGGDVNTGCFNTFLGYAAGRYVTTSQDNIMMGRFAGKKAGVGNGNIFLGAYAGTQNGTAADNDAANNIAMGWAAGCGLTDGDNNIFMGNNAGSLTTTGLANVMIGNYAGDNHVSGSENVYISHCAGRCMCSGSANIAIGHQALQGSSTLSDNTGHTNIAVGKNAGCVITSGCYNILIGQNAGDAITSGANLIAIGCGALSAEDTNTNGSVAIGQDALAVQNTVSLGNVAVGKDAGKAVTSAGENTFLGYSAGSGVTGSGNVSIGTLTLTASTSGADNVVIGKDAGRNNTGDNNVIIGSTAGDASGAGEQNVFVGRNSGSAVTDGQSNTFIGMNAGNSTTTGNGNVMIGANVCLANGNCSFAIGRGTNYWIQGDSSYNTTVNDISASNFNSTSDIRLKTNIQPIGDPIGKVKQIEGVSFNWKKDDKPALGVIADQVEKILPELVHGDDPKTVNYNGLIGLLIETVKEQQNQIDELNERISKLE